MYEIRELKEFPELLQEIPDKPKKLFYRGELPDWENKIFLTVVGSRRFSEYGRAVCEKLIKELAGYPIVIISGLALGTDALAHEAALEAGLTTIAFPGSGLDDSVIAPASNFSLAMRILESGGALFSEYEPKQKAAVWTFPKRNRLMAGISHAVLVIEANQKSGTLITSRLATEYNRDVMTVPGSIFRQQAAGPNMLLRLGAYPVTCGEDIVNHFGLEKKNNSETSVQEPELNGLELQIWELLSEPRAKQFVFDNLEASITDINISLSSLELKGLIVEAGSKIHRS